MGLLPDKPNPVNLDFDRQTKVFHGEPGTGKTSLMDRDGVLILSTENRCGHCSKAIVFEVTSKKEVEAAVEDALKRSDIHTICFDVVSNLWKFNEAAYCQMKGIKTLLDEKYPPGYGIIENELHALFLRIMKTKTLVLITHSVYDETTIEGPNGVPVPKTKWIPDAYKRLHQVMKKITYLEGFLQIVGGKRVLHVNPSDKWEATAKLPMGASRIPEDLVIPEGADGYAILKEAYQKCVTVPKT